MLLLISDVDFLGFESLASQTQRNKFIYSTESNYLNTT